MAKVKLGNLSPGAVPLTRGGFLIRDTKHGPVAQAWPKKRGKAKTAADLWAQKRFGVAAIMAANPFWLDYLTAVHMVKGTTLVPRDWLMMCAVGKAYILQLEDGTEWPSRTSMSINPQLVLDEISSTPGSILYRESYGWVGGDPGNPGYVLTMENGMPTWKEPAGGIGLGSLVTTLYRTTDETPVAGTSHFCTFQAAAVDENHLWDAGNPSRLYFPATANRIRLSAQLAVTAQITAQPFNFETIDSAGNTIWLGSLREVLCHPATLSTNRQISMIGPWVPKPTTTWCRMRLNTNISFNLGYLKNSSITIEVA
jgi:hypothetical protein